MKKLTNKFLNGLAKTSVSLCIFVGIVDTGIFIETLYEYNLHLYQSGVVLIPPVVGMVLFYGLAILISIMRKRQYKYMKKKNSDEKDN